MIGENEVTIGEGWNYGIETSLRRSKGKANGYLNYTWSKAERRFDGLSNNERFPFRYNREHVVKIGINYEFSPKFSIFTTWTYGSGQHTTPQQLNVYGGGESIDVFQLDQSSPTDLLNTFQLPANHHLDISFNFHWSKKDIVDHYFSFGLSNAYARGKTPYLWCVMRI